MYRGKGNWINDDNNFKESRKTTTRMTVIINDVMPQGTETRVEEEAGNNISNKGDMGTEMSDAARKAGGAADQLSNRRRREKERKRKYCAKKSGPVEAESASIASQQMKRAKIYCIYQSKEHVKVRDADNKRNKR